MTDPQVLVVGAGVIGLSTALQLARRGLSVVVCESGTIGGGASRTNAGWVVPSMSDPVPSPSSLWTAARWLGRRGGPLRVHPRVDPQYLSFLSAMVWAARPAQFRYGLAANSRLANRAIEAFDELADLGLDFERHRSGVLMLFSDDHHLRSHVREFDEMSEAGLPDATVLDASGLRQLEPSVSDHVAGGILCSHDQYVDPGALVDALGEACRQAGVIIRERSTVAAIDAGPTPIRVRLTHGETLTAGRVVIAAGADSGRVAAMAGMRLPIQPGKGHGIDLAGGQPPVRHALYLAERKVAVTPLDAGLRACGTMEFGSKNRHSDPAMTTSLVNSLSRYLQPIHPVVSQTWAGNRPMTPDGLPVIGRLLPDRPVYIASGHAMLGVTLGPLTGQLLAELVVDHRQTHLLHPFDPRRFRSARRRAMPSTHHD